MLDAVERERCTVTLGVPTMLAAIAEEQHASPRDASTLRAIVHGGSPITTGVLRRLHAALPHTELVEIYGATEMGPVATTLRGEQAIVDEPVVRSCGRAIPGVALRIVDAGGAELATGETGEIAVRGPNLLRAYWNKPEQTAEAMYVGTGTDPVTWATWTRKASSTSMDRAKDMIVSGGENVYGTEVEEVLYQHPGVLEAAVFGVPDDKWGEAVHAVVVRREEAGDLEAEELIAFCRERLGGYKVPKGIDFQSEALPKSGPGKILKRQLRAPYWEGRERQI